MKFLDRLRLKAAEKLARMMDLDRFCEWLERMEKEDEKKSQDVDKPKE